ncbi:MAG: DUF1330 domain-containing protein [Parvularculaceae bacterium]
MAHVTPSPEQIAAMMSAPDDGPILMLNLIQLREKADYPDDRDASGAEAYTAYAREIAPALQGVGGEVVFSGAPKLMVIGPEDERWDLCFVVRYPSAAAFGEMLADPVYQAAAVHRTAAVADSRLVRMAPDA